MCYFLGLKFFKNLRFSLSEHCEWGTRSCPIFSWLHMLQCGKDLFPYQSTTREHIPSDWNFSFCVTKLLDKYSQTDHKHLLAGSRRECGIQTYDSCLTWTLFRLLYQLSNGTLTPYFLVDRYFKWHCDKLVSGASPILMKKGQQTRKKILAHIFKIISCHIFKWLFFYEIKVENLDMMIN